MGSRLLILLRAVLMGAWFFFCSLIVLLVGVFRPFNYKNGALFRHLALPWCRTLLGLEIDDRECKSLRGAKPSILIFNHQSSLDVITFGIAAPDNLVAVGKKSLVWVPLFGWMFWLAGGLFIDRSNRERAMRTLQTAKRRLSSGANIFIAPEGTRSRGRALGPFKRGAFHLAIQTQADIVPIVASTYTRTLNFGRWKAGRVRMRALPGVSTVGMTENDIPMLIDKMHESMRIAIEEMDRSS